MSNKYETEQSELKIKAKELGDIIEKESVSSINAKNFISQIKKYTEFEELNCEILRTFIEKVLINEHTKVDGVRHQEIEIYYNGIGKVDIEKV